MYTQRAVWCAMLALSCLAATMSRRTRAQPAETAAVAMQPPQDAPEAQLSQLRAKYHLPMATVAQLLGFFDGAGEVDTKKAYQTLLAIRKRRNTHHSGEQELGTHCDRKGDKKGERHEYPWYWWFRQPGCDDAYTGEETFPGLLAFDVDTQCRVVQVLEKELSALRAGLKSHPGPEDADHLRRWHALVEGLCAEYPQVLYYSPGPRDTARHRAEAVRVAVLEMVSCRLLPDPQSSEVCDMQTDDAVSAGAVDALVPADPTPTAEEANGTETIVNFTSVDDAEQALQALQAVVAADAADAARRRRPFSVRLSSTSKHRWRERRPKKPPRSCAACSSSHRRGARTSSRSFRVCRRAALRSRWTSSWRRRARTPRGAPCCTII